MRVSGCDDVREALDEYVRQELGARRSAVLDTHLATCASCTTEAEQARRAMTALDAVRGDALLGDFDEDRRRVLRARVMFAVAEAPRSSPGFFGLRAFYSAVALAAAAMVAVVGSLAVLSGPPDAPGAIARHDDPRRPVSDQAVEVVTFATKDGVSLHWSGDAATYVVLKSSRPSLEPFERTVVCGTDWTDRAPARGATFYRVVPADEPCRT